MEVVYPIEALSTTQRVKLIEKKEFAIITLNLSNKAFVVHVVFIASLDPTIYPSRWARIASLKANKAPITILSKYANFTDVSSSDLVVELPKHIKIHDYAIELIDSKQLPYWPIYIIEQVELETLKTYIKTNLPNGFIKPSNSPANTPILFFRKLNSSLHLCVNYQDLNKFIIKNCYSYLLIDKSPDRLG